MTYPFLVFYQAQLALVLRVQRCCCGLLPIFYVIHWMGKRDQAKVVVPIFMYFLLPFQDALGTVAAAGIAGAVGALGKHVLRVPRPYWVDCSVQKKMGVRESTYATPSQHSTQFAAILAVVSTTRNTNLDFGLGGLFILIVMVSRMYFGVHWPQDVVIGSSIGILTGLCVCLTGLGGYVANTGSVWPIAGVFVGPHVVVLAVMVIVDLARPPMSLATRTAWRSSQRRSSLGLPDEADPEQESTVQQELDSLKPIEPGSVRRSLNELAYAAGMCAGLGLKLGIEFGRRPPPPLQRRGVGVACFGCTTLVTLTLLYKKMLKLIVPAAAKRGERHRMVSKVALSMVHYAVVGLTTAAWPVVIDLTGLAHAR